VCERARDTRVRDTIEIDIRLTVLLGLLRRQSSYGAAKPGVKFIAIEMKHPTHVPPKGVKQPRRLFISAGANVDYRFPSHANEKAPEGWLEAKFRY
jgi:hypothetical protein